MLYIIQFKHSSVIRKIYIMRVAVTQFATSLNVQENLATCIRMINEAAVCEPSVIVLPEYSNTQLSYLDHNQAWSEGLPADGVFLQEISAQAKKHSCYIVLNVTLRRDLVRDHQDGSLKSNISITSCLFSPLGELIHQVDKQTLTAYESDFFISRNDISEAVTTPLGKLGLLTGNDDITFEASRELALHGAQLLCHSMNTFALDQSRLHGPARACENKMFLAAANKVGSLISQKNSAQIPQEYLVALGQSQIVSPSGKVLAKLAHNEEGFTFADIDMDECSLNNKFRPDGTDLIKQRRPELYQALKHSTKQTKQAKQNVEDNIPATVNAAIFATYKSNEQAIEDVCHYIDNNLSDIIQLPELFFIADKTITNNAQQLNQIACLSQQVITQISSVLRPFQYVCTSLVIDGVHHAVLISEQGLFATQQQLHFCQRYQWTALGDELNIIKLPLEQGSINVAMLTADDANTPEIVKEAALNNIHLLLVPFDIQEACEVEYSLLARAAENRICLVAASREKSFANDLLDDNCNKNSGNNNDNKKKVKAQKSTGLIANLTTKKDLLISLKSGKFDGYINQPLVKHQHGKITKAVIHPVTACDKEMATKIYL